MAVFDKLPPLTIKQLASIMALRNPSDANYLNGSALVALFNSMGFLDAYTFTEGIGIQTADYGNGLSRLNYTLRRLDTLNKQNRVSEAIQKFLSTIENPQEAIILLEEIGIHVQSQNGGFKIIKSFYLGNEKGGAAEITNPANTAKKIAVAFSTGFNSIDIEDFKQNEKKQLESIVGEIPKGRLVIFISYSWDSYEHKEWVRKLADDLTRLGIFVLLDTYLPAASLLPEFMDLGLHSADKVLIIGTRNYRLKSSSSNTGVAFEGFIVRHMMFEDLGSKKFIPCLREGDFMHSFPSIITGNKGYDFSDDANYEMVLDSLCRELYGKSLTARPLLGDIPDYAK